MDNQDPRKIPNATLPLGGVDLSELGKDPDRRSKLERQLTRYFQQNDTNIDNIIFTIELLWEHIAAISRKLDISADEMAHLVVEREANQRWLTASSEEEVKLRDINKMFNAKPTSEKERAESPEAQETTSEAQGSNEPGDEPVRPLERGSGDTESPQENGDQPNGQGSTAEERP